MEFTQGGLWPRNFICMILERQKWILRWPESLCWFFHKILPETQMNFLANSTFTSLADICLPESRLCPLMISDLRRVFCSNQHDRYLLKKKKTNFPNLVPRLELSVKSVVYVVWSPSTFLTLLSNFSALRCSSFHGALCGLSSLLVVEYVFTLNIS